MLKRELPESLRAVKTIALYAKGESIEGAEVLEHPAVLIIRGNEMYRSHDYANAYSAYKEAYSKNPELIEARVNMGFALIRLGRDDEARKIFENLPENYVNEYVLNELGNIYARAGKLERAGKYYLMAMEKAPEFTLPKINFAVLALAEGKPERAYETLKQIREIESEYRPYFFKVAAITEYHLGKAEDALNHILTYLETNENDPTAWLLKAECEGVLGNTQDAEKSAKKSYELKPTVSAQSAIAAFKLENGDTAGALSIGEKLAAKNVNDPRLFRTLARASFYAGKNEEAYNYATRALELKEMPAIRMIRGESARRLGRYEIALQDAEHVLTQYPDYRNAKILKALALANLGDYEAAQALLESAGGDDFLIHTAYAELYMLTGNKRNCAESLERALKHRESVPHLRRLCLILYELGELDRMESYIRRLTDLESKDAYLWFLRGEILFGKNPDEAERYYQMAIEIDPRLLDAYARLATIAIIHGDTEKINRYLEHIAKLGGTAKLWRTILQALLEHEYYEDILKYSRTAVSASGDETLEIFEIRALIALARYQDAEALAQKLVEAHPEQSEAKLYLAIAEYHLKKYTTAMKRFVRLTDVYELDANYYIAKIYFETGRGADALELAEKYGYDTRFVMLKIEILYALKSYEALLAYVAEIIKTLTGKELTRALFYRMRAQFAMGSRDDGYKTGMEILERDPGHTDTLLLLAEQFYEDGDYDRAEHYAAQALQIEETPESLLIHARALKALERYEEAMESLKKLLNTEEREEYLVLGAEILLSMNRPEEAREFANRALDMNKNSVPAMVILGRALYVLGDYAESRKYFERVFIKDVGNMDALYYLPLCYYHLKDYEKASKMFERAFEKNRAHFSELPEFVEAYAAVLYALKRYVDAEELLLAFEPRTDLMALLLGKVQYEMHRYDEAEHTLEQITDESLRGEKIYYLVQTLIARHDYERAEALLSELEDETGELLYYHGLVLYNLEKYEEALEKFNAYRGAGGARDDLDYYLGACLYHTGKYEESIRYLEHGERVNDLCFVYEAQAHYRIGRHREAIKFFEICIKKDIMTPEMWYMYGASLESTGSDGKSAYVKAWERGYRDPNLAYILLKKYMDEGEPARAVEYAERAVSVGPDAIILGAQAYMALDDPAHAYQLMKDEDSPELVSLKSKLLVQMGRVEEAERLLEAHADVPENAYELVKIKVMRGRYEEAASYVELGEKHGALTYEKMLIGYHLENWESALRSAEEIIEKGEHVSEASYIAGVALYNLGRYDEAINMLRNGEGAEKDYYLGLAYYRTGDYERAVRHLEASDEPGIELGLALYEIGEYSKALEHLKSKDDRLAREYGGLCALKLGEYQVAVELLKDVPSRKNELAEAYYHLGDYERVVSLNPDNPHLMGLAYFNLGNMSEAIKSFEALDSPGAEDYYYLALAHLKLGNYEEAERNLTLARKHGYEGDLTEYEGIIAYSKGDYKTAASLLKSSTNREARRVYGLALYHLGRYSAAEAVLKEYTDDESLRFYAESLMHQDVPEKLKEAQQIFERLGLVKSAAGCALKLGNYERVIYYLKDVSDDDALSMKFEAYVRLGRSAEAVKIYDRLPESGKATYARDMCGLLVELKKYDEAKRIMDSYFYEDYEWLILRAKIYVAEGNSSEAVSALKRAKKLNPNSPEIPRLLAPLLLNEGHEKEALKEAKRAVKDFPDDAVCWYNLGLAYEKTGQRKKAEEALKKCVSIDENFAEAWHLLGIIHLDDGHYESAYSELSRVKSSIRDRDVLVSLAMTAYQLEKYGEALEYIDMALDMKKDAPGLYYRALILVELGREDEARAVLKEVIDISPGFVEARKLLGSLMGGE